MTKQEEIGLAEEYKALTNQHAALMSKLRQQVKIIRRILMQVEPWTAPKRTILPTSITHGDFSSLASGEEISSDLAELQRTEHKIDSVKEKMKRMGFPVE